MKEAFRIADVHRRGVVDVSELGLLLEKLMPYAGSQGIGGLEQYVDEFMQLVDKDNDGKISFGEFMLALNEGFRLELEIYDDQPQVPISDVVPGSNGSQLTRSSSTRLLRRNALRCNSIQSMLAGDSGDSSRRRSSNFADMVALKTSKPISISSKHVKSKANTGRRRRLSSASESSAPEALLNVEAFTLTEAGFALKQSYSECLLGYIDDHNKRVTMEDFIGMSCVISACENIAENLTRLNTLAAS